MVQDRIVSPAGDAPKSVRQVIRISNIVSAAALVIAIGPILFVFDNEVSTGLHGQVGMSGIVAIGPGFSAMSLGLAWTLLNGAFVVLAFSGWIGTVGRRWYARRAPRPELIAPDVIVGLVVVAVIRVGISALATLGAASAVILSHSWRSVYSSCG